MSCSRPGELAGREGDLRRLATRTPKRIRAQVGTRHRPACTGRTDGGDPRSALASARSRDDLVGDRISRPRDLPARRFRARDAPHAPRRSAAEIIICSGAQQSADIVASTVLESRAVVAAESPTYAGTLGVFDARGASYVEVASDGDGVRVDDVERVFSEYRPRLFYINPVSQNPTGAVLPPRRAKAIVALARRYDVVILEDQTTWMYTYEASAPPPLAAYDTDGHVIVTESLSKAIFPALRIGYLYVKGSLRSALQAAKVRTDSFTSTLMQRALWRFLSSPAAARHLRAARALYRARRDACVEALIRSLPWAEVRPPAAGYNVWLPLPARISSQAAFDECAREGVLVMPAEPFYPTRSGPAALRLSFGDVDVREIEEGIARVGRALERLRVTPVAVAAGG